MNSTERASYFKDLKRRLGLDNDTNATTELDPITMAETKKRKAEEAPAAKDETTAYMAMIILNDGSADHCQVINISKFYNTEQAACQEILEELANDSEPLSCGSREKDIPVAEKINDAANRVLDSPKKCSALTIDRLHKYICKWAEASGLGEYIGYHCKLVKRDNLKTIVEGYQVCTDEKREVEVVVDY